MCLTWANNQDSELYFRLLSFLLQLDLTARGSLWWQRGLRATWSRLFPHPIQSGGLSFWLLVGKRAWKMLLDWLLYGVGSSNWHRWLKLSLSFEWPPFPSSMSLPYLCQVTFSAPCCPCTLLVQPRYPHLYRGSSWIVLWVEMCTLPKKDMLKS